MSEYAWLLWYLLCGENVAASDPWGLYFFQVTPADFWTEIACRSSTLFDLAWIFVRMIRTLWDPIV